VKPETHLYILYIYTLAGFLTISRVRHHDC